MTHLWLLLSFVSLPPLKAPKDFLKIPLALLMHYKWVLFKFSTRRSNQSTWRQHSLTSPLLLQMQKCKKDSLPCSNISFPDITIRDFQPFKGFYTSEWHKGKAKIHLVWTSRVRFPWAKIIYKKWISNLEIFNFTPYLAWQENFGGVRVGYPYSSLFLCWNTIACFHTAWEIVSFNFPQTWMASENNLPGSTSLTHSSY